MDKDETQNKPQDDHKAKAAAEREARLKQALRANLRRRKGQDKLRSQSDETSE